MICRTIGQIILFSQVELPTINRHPLHRPRSAPSAAICAGTLRKMKQSRSLR
jgi:hypothetical protein